MKCDFLQTRILSVFNLLKRVGFALLLLGVIFSKSSVAIADWSPEIILWQNPEGVPSAGMQVAMNVDSFEHLHIVFTFPYRHQSNPNLERVGISYVQYDDIGNQLVPTIFLSDSLDHSAGYPLIRFFGQDSLWVMWVGGRSSDPASYSQKYVSLTLEGQILRPVQDFDRIHRPAGDKFVFEVLDDRSVVVVDADGSMLQRLYMTVERPNGVRVMNDAVIWDSSACWVPHGYIDHTDSLQLVWRQSYLSNWNAVFGRRMDPLTPFDTLTIGDHAVLTPLASYAPQIVQPIGDSLIALVVVYPGNPIQSQLRLIDRDSYEAVNEVILGALSSQINVAVEDESELGTVVGDTSIRALFYRRYRLSDLSMVENTFLAEPESILHSIGARDYVVSRNGIRHATYVRTRSGSSAGNVKIVYRVYSPLLDVREPGATAAEEFSLFPNPTNSRITLYGPILHLNYVEVYNVLGQVVQRFDHGSIAVHPPSISFSLESYQSGVYFFRIVTAHNIVVKKVLLVR